MNRILDDQIQERFRHVLRGLSVFQIPFYYRAGPHLNLVRDLLRQLTNITDEDEKRSAAYTRYMTLRATDGTIKLPWTNISMQGLKFTSTCRCPTVKIHISNSIKQIRVLETERHSSGKKSALLTL
jgi:hypothetical protein